ncbi:hypothetical protein TNCV_2106221 [Trichonephila clavipes]|nr:hypothetical protein TNCV_2106221 [Trichonephila clavipes]
METHTVPELKMADDLSRNPVKSIIREKVNCAIIRDLVLSSREQLIEEERKDSELNHIYRYLENPEDTLRFVEWAQNKIAVVPDFHKRILFSDEAHFWLNGYVNKQTCRIWSEANPQVYVETALHPQKLTVWCA